jgi:hypothetical protein
MQGQWKWTRKIKGKKDGPTLYHTQKATPDGLQSYKEKQP